MGRTKGTQKTGGRTKGTPNKTTAEVRAWIAGLIERNRRQLEKDLAGLEPKDRWAVIEKLMQYTVPKMQSVTAQVDLNGLSDEQLGIVINEITKGIENESTD